MTVELRHLRALLAVRRTLSFSAAADDLGVSQPVVSRTIRQLENDVGAPLVDRTTRRVSMTPRGEILADHAARILDDLRAALDSTAAPEPLHVGFQWALPSPWLTEVVTHYEATGHQITLVRQDDIASALRSGKVDAAIVRTPVEGPDLSVTVLLEEDRVAVVPTASPLAAHTAMTWAELGGHPVVVNTASGTTKASLWPAHQRPAQIVRCSNFDEWAELVATGRGLGSLPVSAARSRPHPGLATVPLTDAPPVRLTFIHLRGLHDPRVETLRRIALRQTRHSSHTIGEVS